MGKGPQFLHSEVGLGLVWPPAWAEGLRGDATALAQLTLSLCSSVPQRQAYVMITISHVSLQAFKYFKYKPIFLALLSLSSSITTLGKIVAHTGPFQLDSLVTCV